MRPAPGEAPLSEKGTIMRGKGFASLWMAPLALVALGGSAMAQAGGAAGASCLHRPAASTDIVKDCTAVIDSGKASPTEMIAALNNRGFGRSMNGDAAGGVKDFDAAIKLGGTIAKLYLNRGNAQLGAQNDKGALADYSKAIELDPNFAVAYTARGEALTMGKRPDDAIRDFDKAIELAPRYLHAMYSPYSSRAQARDDKGDAKGAEADRALGAKLMGPGGQVDAKSPNTAGLRNWEPWITPAMLPKQ